MAYKDIWILCIFGTVHAILLYILGRHILRTHIDISKIVDQLPIVGIGLQIIILAILIPLAIAIFVLLGKALDIHKM